MLKLRIADRGLKILTCVASRRCRSNRCRARITQPSSFDDGGRIRLCEFAEQSPSPTPAQTPSPATSRSVRISFVPPPLEGTISLGIYDRTGKLVRVLYQQAQLNEFAIGADGL